jgi:ketosteroid isomerase-like protein
VVWGRVETDADRRILAAWLDAGHELGSHSSSHPNFTTTSLLDYLADVEKARLGLGAFLSARGRELRFFRFPMLNEGDTREKLAGMRAVLSERGIRNLTVTIDTQDWSFAQPWVDAERKDDRAAMKRIGEEFQDAMRVSVRHHERHGDRLFGRTTPQILLLHANAVGAAQWDSLFSWLEETGHRFAPVDEVLADPAFAEPHEFVFRQGVSLWDRIDHERAWTRARGDIQALLETQSLAWSRGDIDAFCSVYADDALFLAPSGLTRSRQAVLDRYKKRYPTAADMGRLSLEVLEMRPIFGPEVSMLEDSVPSSIHGVSVTARWTLKRAGEREDLTGWTLLVLQRVGREWKIVQDASM